MAVRYCIPVLLFLASTPVQGSDWTRADTNRQVLLTALFVADWGQTLNQSRRYDEGYSERNIILGNYPSRGEINTYFATVTVAHYGVSTILSPKYRATWQWSFIALQVLTVAHNHRAGLRIEF